MASPPALPGPFHLSIIVFQTDNDNLIHLSCISCGCVRQPQAQFYIIKCQLPQSSILDDTGADEKMGDTNITIMFFFT